MQYLTVNTGDVMEWGRNRLEPETYALLRRDITTVTAPVPCMAGFTRRIGITADGPPPDGNPTGGMMLIVSLADDVVAIYGLATGKKSAAQIWQAIKSQSPSIEVRALAFPFLAGLLLPASTAMTPEQLAMMADYAACVAMTMLVERGQKSVAE